MGRINWRVMIAAAVLGALISRSLPLVSTAYAVDGVIVRTSKYPVAEAMDRLEAAIKAGGATVFARIDLKAAARNGELLRPHQLILFGRGGTYQAWLSASSLSGLEFPQKILIFEDPNGKAWVAYNTAEISAQRQGIANIPGIDQTIKAINTTVSGFADSIAE